MVDSIRLYFLKFREYIWFHSPAFLHKLDYFISERRLRYHLYMPWQKTRGKRFYRREVLYIDPSKINYYDGERFFSSFSYIQSGDWDMKKIRIKDKPQFQIVYELFVENVDITKLSNFDTLVSGQKRGRVSQSEARERVISKYEKLKAIYNCIKEEGYKTQKQLGKSCENKFNTWCDEIRVSIDRNGEYILSGSGNHRVAIARLLGLARVPVIIVRIHNEYYAKHKDNF